MATADDKKDARYNAWVRRVFTEGDDGPEWLRGFWGTYLHEPGSDNEPIDGAEINCGGVG